MKILFITTDVGLYGSSKSLRTSLRFLEKSGQLNIRDISLWHQKALATRNAFFHEEYSRLPNKRAVLLPCSGIHIGGRGTFRERTTLLVRNVISLFAWCLVYRRELARKRFDLVYLNTLVLWPLLLLIPRRQPTVIHSREIVDHSRSKLKTRVALRVIQRRASAIVAIDLKAAEPFRAAVVIQNPFVMTRARDLRASSRGALCAKYSLPEPATKIAIIGRIESVKGQRLFLELASQLRQDARFLFLIVGEGAGEYRDSVAARAASVGNVRMLGEIVAIDEIYAIADVVIRCDDFLPLGRTFYEAYYAGCRVVLPCGPRDDQAGVRPFLDRGMALYDAGSVGDLEAKLTMVLPATRSELDARPIGNEAAYVEKFWRFLNHAVGHAGAKSPDVGSSSSVDRVVE